jgi:diguanylate cyclase
VDQTLDHFMESVRSALEKPILVEGLSMTVSASMGMAIYPDDADDSVKLLRIADQRMYALKQRPEFTPKAVKSAVVDSTTIAIAGGQQ